MPGNFDDHEALGSFRISIPIFFKCSRDNIIRYRYSVYHGRFVNRKNLNIYGDVALCVFPVSNHISLFKCQKFTWITRNFKQVVCKRIIRICV